MVEEEAVDHPISDVPVSITILVVSVAVVFTVWVPVIMYRAAIRHGRSTSESQRLAGALVVVFAVWFGPIRRNRKRQGTGKLRCLRYQVMLQHVSSSPPPLPHPGWPGE
jgi:hypothetical protein